MDSRPLKQPPVLASSLAEVSPRFSSSLDCADASREETDFLARTVRVWEGQYGKGLSETDAQDITRNLSRFFDILAEWDQHRAQSGPLRDPYQRNGGRV